MSKKQEAVWLYYAIEELGENYMVMYQDEYDAFLNVFEWYLNKHPLKDDDSTIIKLYASLLRCSNTNIHLRLTVDGNDVLVKQILREYIDEH